MCQDTERRAFGDGFAENLALWTIYAHIITMFDKREKICLCDINIKSSSAPSMYTISEIAPWLFGSGKLSSYTQASKTQIY